MGSTSLREFKWDNVTWVVERDYVHRDGILVAAVQPSGEVYHLHPDHLGSPRLVTKNGGAVAAYHLYHPYGAEATAFNQDTERLKFTGHERDLGLTTSVADDLDYMHARFYNMQIGRFSSVDPKAYRMSLGRPQRWNRYSYSLGNPITMFDPDGREALIFIVGTGRNDIKEASGHAAIFVQRDGQAGGISYGGARGFEKGVADFLKRYLQSGREVTVYVLNTTAQQDRRMLEFLKDNPSGGVDSAAFGADLMWRENCAKAAMFSRTDKLSTTPKTC